MRLKERCLPCIIDQAVKVAEMTGAANREALYQAVFKRLGEMDLHKTTPEIIGQTFRVIKEHLHCEDPYLETRRHYNALFLKKLASFEKKIDRSKDPFKMAMRYAILGNLIDFNPIHQIELKEILSYFDSMETLDFAVDHSYELLKELKEKKTMLYLGDNCGEICLDKLFIKKIKAIHPELTVYFGVRGEPIVNDSIMEDAYEVGIDEYAEIISNGDCSLGTVLPRVSEAFRKIYDQADIVIAKGQANYECLSEEDKNIYFLLFTKCQVIADDIGAPEKALICLNKKQLKKES